MKKPLIARVHGITSEDHHQQLWTKNLKHESSPNYSFTDIIMAKLLH